MLDFPLWLRVSHLINAVFIILLIRSGIEILSAHPKLYTNDKAIDGMEWLKFTKRKMPKDRLWTSMDEEESFNSFVALPGHSNLGLGRHWHFFSIIFWVANGVIYWVLLFASGVWSTLIPTSWSIFPQALKDSLIYASGKLPPPGHPFDAVQQLTYAFVVFILGPFMIASGAAMSPAVDARYPMYPKIFGGRQRARSLHFLAMALFVLFIIVHIIMVVYNRFLDNMANIIYGGGTMSLGEAVLFFVLYFVVVIAINLWATKDSLRRPRVFQKGLGAVVEPVRRALFHHANSRQEFSKNDITPYFRVNGRPPETQEYKDLENTGFRNYMLRVYGLVEKPEEFSLVDLLQMSEHKKQITEHYCIQGWTSIGEWGGVPVSYILKLCKPLPSAKYVVFHSFGTGEKTPAGHGDPSREFYEVIDLELANHPQTILAYEMNYEPIPITHGAPLRLRCETQLGYKMVKWLRSIEVVEDYRKIGDGLGGYREDVQHYGVGAEI
ncbi:MAG: molybdopterin-dependent oxidoreductase [Rhabdochlamydiaceae bacterium]